MSGTEVVHLGLEGPDTDAGCGAAVAGFNKQNRLGRNVEMCSVQDLQSQKAGSTWYFLYFFLSCHTRAVKSTGLLDFEAYRR